MARTKRHRGRQKKRPAPKNQALDPQGMRALIAEHLEWLRASNYAERTVKDREVYLGAFAAWCEERGVTRPREVTKPILERYRLWLYRYRKKDGEPLSFHSQFGRLVPIRMLFRWLSRKNHILYNPAADLELPRLERRLPTHVLTASEAERVLNQVDVSKPLGVRDRAILETFYSTGVRRSELAGLTVYDLDLERGTLMIRQGKGKKDRVVPVGERAAAWTEKYLLEVRSELAAAFSAVPFGEGPDEGVLFLTHRGQAFNQSRLTFLARRYVEAAGIDKRGACHLFRHTMATLMLENGADIRYIQQMLGHADLSTTQIYTQVSIGKLKEVHTRTHPGASLERTAPAIPDEDDEVDLREQLFAELAAEVAQEEE